MTLDDLKHIFKSQLEVGGRLFFMLRDGNEPRAVIERAEPTELEHIVSGLSAFTYAGTIAGMPRFVK